MSKFSIIVPVYNVEKYINRCIDSILYQTIDDFEVILVDDGSSDKSGIICDYYETIDDRVKVIHKKNGGVSSARNAGLDLCQGKYVVFVDSDDYISKDYLQKLYNPNVDMVLCNIKYKNINSDKFYILDNEEYGIFNVEENILNQIIKSKYFCTVYCKLFRKNIIEDYNIRFIEDLSLGEDTVFVVDYIMQIRNLEIKSDVIYNYITYNSDRLSMFKENSIYNLEKCDKYIQDKLSKIYKIDKSEAFNTRKWNKYEWAIFQTINNDCIKFFKKRKILKCIFNNKNYIELAKNIDSYMTNDTKIVRNVLSTRNTNFVMLFFFIRNLKSKIVSSNK